MPIRLRRDSAMAIAPQQFSASLLPRQEKCSARMIWLTTEPIWFNRRAHTASVVDCRYLDQ